MTFEDWWNDPVRGWDRHDTKYEVAQWAWSAAQRELLLELTNAKLDGADTVIAGEMQRVKNFRSLL